MKKTSFYSNDELRDMGFKHIGKDVKISRNSIFYGKERISVGDYSRIDDFCVISAGSGGIEIGRYVHIAIYVSLQGDGKITIEDFAGLSSKTSVYSSNSDYSGDYLSCPNIPEEFTKTYTYPVKICKHSIIGAGSIIMPGVTLHNGAAVGAHSFVKEDCEEFGVYVGNPVKKIKDRRQGLLEKEKMLILNYDKFKVGDTYEFEYSINQEDVKIFSNITGDNNPIHTDPDFASNTIFKQPIVQGLLSSSIFFARMFGTDFPGHGSIYMYQNLKFVKPVFVNQKYKSILKIKEINTEKHTVIIECILQNIKDEVCIIGEAKLKNESKF